jgi:hypothetical protein
MRRLTGKPELTAVIFLINIAFNCAERDKKRAVSSLRM